MSPLTVLATALLWFAHLATADFKFKKLDSSYKASSGITLEWSDDGDDPKFSDLSTVTVLLCTGSNANIDCFTDNPLASQQSLSSLDGKIKLDLTPVAALGGNGPYFIQVAAVGTKSGTDIHYTDRFKLSGMTGSKKATDGGDTDPPPAQNSVGEMDASEQSSLGKEDYTKQTGKTRQAPMQTQPGTKVTMPLKASRRHATSAVTYYSTYRMSLDQVTTLTPGWDYTYSRLTNYAKTQATPSKFYAATAALKSSILAHSKAPTAGPKTKRWLDAPKTKRWLL